jgi:hypothetical protein
MPHNTTINAGAGGDSIADYDLAAGGAYPTTGKVAAGVLYVSPDATTVPAPVTAANGLFMRPGTAATWNVVQAGDLIEIGGATFAVKRAFANATAAGDTTVVAAVASKKIRVLSYAIGPVSAAVNLYLKSSTVGAITSTKYLPPNGGMGRSLNHFGHCETTAGEALAINLSGAANVGIDVLYIEV